MPHMSNAYTAIGKMRIKIYSTLFVVNIIVLALSVRVNQFQDFFFMADLFPLGLSITTLVLLALLLALDFSLVNAITSRPPFEIGLLSVLTIFWLAFNAFSTSRWRHVPLACSSIPADFEDEIVWCRDLQALKAFVWIEWVVLLATLAFTIRYVIKEHVRGNTHVWASALSRYSPRGKTDDNANVMSHHRTSSFWAGTSSSFRG